MYYLLEKFGSVFSVRFVIMVVIIGLILTFWDSKKLKQENMKKEYKMAKVLGILYLSLGIVLYIAGKIY